MTRKLKAAGAGALSSPGGANGWWPEEPLLRRRGQAPPATAGARGGRAEVRLHRLERLIEVGEDVLDVLDADGDPDESRRAPETVSLGLRDRAVRHRRRVRDERLDSAEAL